MASPSVLDIEALLAPISESAPTGVNPRADTSPTSPYFRLKDARSAARAAERRADSEAGEAGPLPEWDTIMELAPQVLGGSAKDLEVTAWYIEALVRAHGFAGFRDGCLLAQGLCDRYWDSFFSLEDDDGLLTRLAPLAGLNGVDSEGTLVQPLRKVPITVPGEFGPFSAYHYEQAFALAQVADAAARAKREAAGAVTLDKFNRTVADSGAPFYIGLLDDLAGATKAFEGLTATLDTKAGEASPPSSNVHDLLEAIAGTVRNISKDIVARHVQSNAPAAAIVAEDGATVAPAGPSGAPRGREEALQQLLQVADFFKNSEPHSPIATTLEEAVRRARLPFSELLAELLPDAAAWRSALTIAGIKPPPPPAKT